MMDLVIYILLFLGANLVGVLVTAFLVFSFDLIAKKANFLVSEEIGQYAIITMGIVSGGSILGLIYLVLKLFIPNLSII